MNKHQSSDMQLARWFHFHREIRDICVREYNDRYYDNSYECQCDRGQCLYNELSGIKCNF